MMSRRSSDETRGKSVSNLLSAGKGRRIQVRRTLMTVCCEDKRESSPQTSTFSCFGLVLHFCFIKRFPVSNATLRCPMSDGKLIS